MKPLRAIAMGLVVIVLAARISGFDAVPDPLGWVLVAIGVAALRLDVARRGTLLGLAALAGAVSVVLWFPAVRSGLDAADPSLTWAVSLPEVAFVALLCHTLAGLAGGDRADPGAARWLGAARTAVIVVGVLPVLVFGAGWASLEPTTYLAATLVVLLVIWLLAACASRDWARSETSTGAAPPGGGTAPVQG
jgi:hypothetical protein